MVRDYARRLIICLLGLAMYALGTSFGVIAGRAGTNGWNTMALGLSNVTGIRFGMAVFSISLVIIIIDIIGKGKLGIGTVLNIFIVSSLSDVFLMLLAFIPEPPNVIVGTLYALLGQLIIAFATVVYMSPGLGAGPRDTLMVIVGKAFPRAPIGIIKFVIEIAALISGILMGADFGIGTVLVIALQASFFQFACRVCRFEPRSIVNEDLADTWKKIYNKNK